MRPRETCPGTNGPSSFTRNHSPNSRWSVNARQTRDTGAFNSICFSMLSFMRNLLVAAYLACSVSTRNHFIALWSADRRPQHLFDIVGAGCQHDEAIEAERDAGAF